MKTPRKHSSWYAMYPGDWRSGTGCMTALERGIYRELLDEQFLSGPLPACERKLRMIARCDQDEWDQARDAVLAKFETVDGRLVNARMESERNEREGIRQMKVEAARKSHESRRKNNSANCKTPHSANCKTPPSANCVHVHDHVTVSKDTVEGTALPFGPGFASAWDDWIAYRREARHKAWSPRSIKTQLGRLGKLTESEAIEVINRSIANGWQGLFPEKAKTNGNEISDADADATIGARPTF